MGDEIVMPHKRPLDSNQSGEQPGLKRSLGLFQVTVAGVGIILGAGIYALLGVAAKTSGNATWLAFLISAMVALFTGLSYAELASMFRGNSGEYKYIKEGLSERFGFFIALTMIAAGVVSAAAVALGFAGYFTAIVPVPLIAAALGLILFTTLINFVGIKQTNTFNIVSTFIEFGGLILIIILGIKHFGSVNYFEMPHGVQGVFSSAALVFFAYMGFESIIKLREETIEPEKNIPKALIYSTIITSIVYLLVAVSAVSIIGWEQLASSPAPLAEVAAAALGSYALISFGVIALFSTANTVLITMVAVSRQMYGMAKENSLPKFFAKVHKKTGTPYVAILVLLGMTLAFVLIGKIGIVANLTDLFLFITFATVNLSLIVLRYTKKDVPRPFKCPGNIGCFSMVGLLGFLSSAGMIFFVVLNLLHGVH